MVEEGDRIVIDIPNRRLDVDLPDELLQARLEAYNPRPPALTEGFLATYSRLVGPASSGAMFGYEEQSDL